jgi:hypothetical protein
MINFIEGQINLGAKNISAASDDEDLKTLAEEGLIEKRKSARGEIYYYVETVADGMRFGVFISLREKKIEWLRLSWLDSAMKDWDDIGDKALKDEYHMLLDLVEKSVGRPPDNKKIRQRIWCSKWGQIEVSYEPRAFQTNIFMVPR